MLDSFTKTLSKLFGSKSDRDLKGLNPILHLILQEYPKYSALSNDALREKTLEFKERIRQYILEESTTIETLQKQLDEDPNMDVDTKESVYAQVDACKKNIDAKTEEILQEILPEAFSVVKETAKRFTENSELEVTPTQHDRDLAAVKSNVIIRNDKAYHQNTWMAAGNTVKWDMVHYDSQLIGGTVLHQGKIAEMATGEGKTLVATLPIYLNALAGRGVHIVTVNDYLSRRDAEWNGPIFKFLGLTVDCIDKHEPNSEERKKAYRADITYGTNNEFGFDYLRDNMARNTEDIVQREHFYAIVDEVDSVLIDDARTPLIISGPTPKGENHEFFALRPRVDALVNAQRNYINTALVDAKKLLAEKKEDEGGLALLRAYRGLPKNKPLIKFLGEPGMRSQLQKTENLYMQDQAKEMHKVDTELYFVIDEKNNSVELTEKGIEYITSSAEDKDFFILPDVGSEIADIEKTQMTDAERLEAKDILLRDFSIKSERIHTITQLLKAYTLFEKDVEYIIADSKIKIVDEQTGRVLDGRRYSDGLHQAIEAKENVKIEAVTQTFATITLQNYFRMFHKLSGMTGTAETEAGEFWEIYKLDVVVIPTNRNIVRKDEEDLVYKTKREKYNAVIEEIVKLTTAGRPVLVGTTSVEISELLSRMLKLRGIKHNVLNAKLHKKEADIVAEAGFSGTVTIATNMAGRGTDIKLGPGVKESGGLAIIGTERHDSRRVDRQLRGRAGRQGDPGSSQFFVSLEDDLMRLFGSDRIARLMDRMGIEEGEVIQHSMISRSIERAQKKVEENNFGIRKRLLEYDDVMNSQREVVYKKRRHALYGERLALDILNMMYDVASSTVLAFQDSRDYEGFKFELIKIFSIETPVDERAFLGEKPESITEKVFEAVQNQYRYKGQQITAKALPILQDILKNSGQQFENISVPFTDGIRGINVVANLEKAVKEQSRELINAFEKTITLSEIDEAWKEHLREMDELKQSVQNAVYEQKDPLLIYKFESFELFKQMIEKVNKDIISFLFKGVIPIENPQAVSEARDEPHTDLSKMKMNRSELDPNSGAPKNAEPKAQPVRVDQKIIRNEPCPCGSGKKFKNCHGAA